MKPSIPELAQDLIPYDRPGEGRYYAVGEAALKKAAASWGLDLRSAMIRCLDKGAWPERLRSNRGSFTLSDQARLLRSRAAVMGAGGLGGMAVLQLTRLGLGGLTVCDSDVFDESNLNRQFLSRPDRMGKSKALAAAEEAAAINPAVEVRALAQWADAGNLPLILADADVALDCLDNMETRYLLEEACQTLGIPYVHGALAGFEGMVMTVMPGDPGLKGLYGPTPAEKKDAAEVRLGMPGPTPAVVACLQVVQAVQVILGKNAGQSGMIHIDLGAPSLETFHLS